MSVYQLVMRNTMLCIEAPNYWAVRHAVSADVFIKQMRHGHYNIDFTLPQDRDALVAAIIAAKLTA